MSATRRDDPTDPRRAPPPRGPADAVALSRLSADDAPAYRRLMLDGYGRHPDAFTATVDERAALPLDWWIARIERDIVIGARDGDRLVGAAGLERATRPKTRHKATLFGMVVEPAHSGRGIGRRLVDALLDEACRQPRLRVVQLTVTDGNAAARSLYERCGFTAFGIEPFAVASGSGYASKVHLWIDLAVRDARPTMLDGA